MYQIISFPSHGAWRGHRRVLADACAKAGKTFDVPRLRPYASGSLRKYREYLDGIRASIGTGWGPELLICSFGQLQVLKEVLDKYPQEAAFLGGIPMLVMCRSSSPDELPQDLREAFKIIGVVPPAVQQNSAHFTRLFQAFDTAKSADDIVTRDSFEVALAGETVANAGPDRPPGTSSPPTGKGGRPIITIKPRPR